MSRFPKITETFVLYEMAALQRMGARVEVFPLLRQPPGRRHPEAAAFEGRAHFMPLLSPRVVLANIKRFLRMPRRYVGTWGHVLRGTWGSANFFAGALAYYPKCVVFAERMERLEVDHIHAHFANHPALAALIVHRLTGIPFSFTAHGSDLHVDRRMLPDKVAEAAFVVTVSDYNRELIAEECEDAVGGRVVVIHCGADPAVFADASRPTDAQDRREGGSFRIVCVASLEEVKGHRFLMSACKLLVDGGVDVRCDLAGDGPLRAEVERMIAACGIEGRVHIHGAVPQAEVRRLLAEADVAVLLSHPTPSGKREGIPVALMEAMLSGLPVVASGLSGIPELVEDGRTGFLVVPGDPWSVADKLERLALDPELRHRMGAAGRRKVVSEFDLSTGARLLLDQIQLHAATSRPSPGAGAAAQPSGGRIIPRRYRPPRVAAPTTDDARLPTTMRFGR
jgi:glycosyltransferase involved in cell wall biosynthesis